jgi:spore germination cell wall hydrolase CwlJ-like protein
MSSKTFIKVVAAYMLFISTPALADPVECLARVIHHEARGESQLGQKAVGFVAVNRTKSGRFPSSICMVATQRGQFTNFHLNKPIAPSILERFRVIANLVLASKISDPTGGALFFRASYMGKPKKSATRIGNHYFYR